MVWTKAEFPSVPPGYREEVASRTEAIARISELVIEIEAGRIPADPSWRPPWSPRVSS